jgi:hypothetical protein
MGSSNFFVLGLSFFSGLVAFFSFGFYSFGSLGSMVPSGAGSLGAGSL